MDSDELQQISERDQLWASLRGLTDEIERLASGELSDPERQARLAVLLSRIVLAELSFRSQDANS
jgi:chromosome condensin MukBEF ATPase and DNA-binding subunit MukB